jgi:hypothetical protein
MKIYIARVIGIEKSPTSKEGVFNQTIMVAPLYSTIDGGNRSAYPPSFMPFTILGGGVTSIPSVGTMCLVYDPDWIMPGNSVYILGYIPNDAVGPEGLYNPEEQIEGATVFKVGGEVKSCLTLAPGGIMSLYSNPFTFLKLNGTLRTFEVDSNSRAFNYRGGYDYVSYSDKHARTGESQVHEARMLLGKRGADLVYEDYDLELEQVNLLAASTKYNDKVVIRSGTIYNYNANIGLNKEKTDIGNIYQLETRQCTANDYEKDTVTVLRLGYQKEDNLKNGTHTVYPAGTLIDWAVKRVKTDRYSTYLMRYGKLENDTTGSEAEQTKGEVYRFQLYNDVIKPIAIPGTDPLGTGKGWSYELVNSKATEQYSISFGLLANKSFYREHIHAYPELSRSTLNSFDGTNYTRVLGGDYDKYENTHKISNGKLVYSHIVTLKDDEFSIVNEQPDDSTTQSILLTKDKMSISLKADKTTTVEIRKASEIILDADKVRIGKSSLTLHTILIDLLEAIDTLTLKTSQGPTVGLIPPSTAKIDAVRTKINSLMMDVK